MSTLWGIHFAPVCQWLPTDLRYLRVGPVCYAERLVQIVHGPDCVELFRKQRTVFSVSL